MILKGLVSEGRVNTWRVSGEERGVGAGGATKPMTRPHTPAFLAVPCVTYRGNITPPRRSIHTTNEGGQLPGAQFPGAHGPNP